MNTNLSFLRDLITQFGDKLPISFSTWSGNTLSGYYLEMRETIQSGYYSLDGEIYVVSYTSGSRGMGGMDAGTPPSATLDKINNITQI